MVWAFLFLTLFGGFPSPPRRLFNKTTPKQTTTTTNEPTGIKRSNQQTNVTNGSTQTCERKNQNQTQPNKTKTKPITINRQPKHQSKCPTKHIRRYCRR
ncbi:MAG: hypothetical protein ACTS6G_02080 [Candidatus Hodgkinia cicadicola]